MNVADQLASDMIRMGQAKTWAELETLCRTLDARYADEGPFARRVYEAIKTHHAKRLAGTVMA